MRYGLLVLLLAVAALAAPYAWVGKSDARNTLEVRFPVPAGFVRTAVPAGSFAKWLRGLPLKGGNPPIVCYNGRLKEYQADHAAIVNIDVGTQDLQQCADTVIRLHAEYLFGTGRARQARYSFGNGFVVDFAHWADGYRPRTRGKHTAWVKCTPPDASHANFRAYLTAVFAYASTRSLPRDLEHVAPTDIRPGDVLLRPGDPGHAMLVADMAIHPCTHVHQVLMIQGYMPAQNAHVLRDPDDTEQHAWFPYDPTRDFVTLEYTFKASEVWRFKVQ